MLHIIVAFFLVIYIVCTVNFFDKMAKNEKCTNVMIKIVSDNGIPYLSLSKVYSFLNHFNLNPIGKSMAKIDVRKIKSVFEKRNRLTKKIKIYKTIGSILKIEIQQRTPILRVMSQSVDYFVDDEQKIMTIPTPNSFVFYLPVATGEINEKYAREQLCPFAVFLKKNEFWCAQIDQIYVYPNLDIELVPHVGQHRILLGKIDNFKNKLNNLKLFYEQCFGTIGWNRYSIINLKYKNQIVCTKKN